MSLTQIQRTWVEELVFNLMALLLIFLVPIVSRSFQVPFYYVDPMRLVVVLAIANTSRRNAYIIAIIIPLFSFVISSHPSIYKMLAIMTELILNLALFYYLAERFKTVFVAMLASIVISKMIYYLLKYFLIEVDLIQASLFSTPWLPQMIMTLAFSIYIWMIFSFVHSPQKKGSP